MSEQIAKLNIEEKLIACIELVQKRQADIQALRDEVARLRGIMEEAASAPGKDWLEWQLKLGAALTPQGKGQQVLKSGQSQEISSYAEGKGGGE